MDEKYTIKDLYKIVGKELGDRVVKVCGEEDEAVSWFYNGKIKPYGGRTPFELYQIDKNNLERILATIDFGCIS
jgi:hypothetical protein